MVPTVKISDLARLWRLSIPKANELLIENGLDIDTITYMDIYRLTLVRDEQNGNCFCRINLQHPIYSARIQTRIRISQCKYQARLRSRINQLYKDLYAYIRERDGNACIRCNSKGIPSGHILDRLHIHHINLVHSDMVPENMVTLCGRCHMDIHNGNHFLQ